MSKHHFNSTFQFAVKGVQPNYARTVELGRNTSDVIKVIRTETPGNGQVVDPALGLRRFNHYVPVLIAESFGTKRP